MSTTSHRDVDGCKLLCSRRNFVKYSILGALGVALFGCGGGNSRSAAPPYLESLLPSQATDKPPVLTESGDGVYAVMRPVTDADAIPFLTADNQMIEFASYANP